MLSKTRTDLQKIINTEQYSVKLIQCHRFFIYNLLYCRDLAGNEIDLIIEHADRLNSIAIKTAKSYASDFVKHQLNFKNLSNKKRNTFFVYGGKATKQKPDKMKLLRRDE